MNKQQFFTSFDQPPQQEIFQRLNRTDSAVVVERIISNGHSTPEGQWYDQENHEWVMLLKGEAKLTFADGQIMHLHPGDYVDIPAHCKHRVDWTTPEQESLWLAVHYPA